MEGIAPPVLQHLRAPPPSRPARQRVVAVAPPKLLQPPPAARPPCRCLPRRCIPPLRLHSAHDHRQHPRFADLLDAAAIERRLQGVSSICPLLRQQVLSTSPDVQRARDRRACRPTHHCVLRVARRRRHSLVQSGGRHHVCMHAHARRFLCFCEPLPGASLLASDIGQFSRMAPASRRVRPPRSASSEPAGVCLAVRAHERVTRLRPFVTDKVR